MPVKRRKMKGGRTVRTIAGINPLERSNAMMNPVASQPKSLWERVKNFAKQHKLLSRGLDAVSGMVGDKYAPLVKGASSIASSYGYGKRKRRARAQKGAGVVRF